MRPHRALLLLLGLLGACAGPREATQPTQAGLLPAPSAQAAPTADAGPLALLWEVTKEGAPDRPLYLTGSIHMGRPEQFVLPPSVEAAFARASALVVELDPEAARPAAVQALVFKLGVALPPAKGLSETLSPETRALLPAALARVGLTQAAVERMRPWLLATTLSVLELHKAGYSEKGGIDLMLLRRARGQKAIVELESMEGQLSIFAGLSHELQEAMLREAIKSAPMTGVSVASMATAWEGGNAAALGELVYESAKDPRYAAFYEAFFYARNRSMADQLAGLLDKPGIHFVAVGAGHVVGAEGIPSLLERKGFKVRQLPRASP